MLPLLLALQVAPAREQLAQPPRRPSRKGEAQKMRVCRQAGPWLERLHAQHRRVLDYPARLLSPRPGSPLLFPLSSTDADPLLCLSFTFQGTWGPASHQPMSSLQCALLLKSAREAQRGM